MAIQNYNNIIEIKLIIDNKIVAKDKFNINEFRNLPSNDINQSMDIMKKSKNYYFILVSKKLKEFIKNKI